MFITRALLAAVTALALVSGSALGADPAGPTPLTAQQKKMGACNKQAAGKIGDERKAFMKTCLGADHAAAETRQQRMKSCHADATRQALKGDERKAYMKTCLSNDGAAAD